LSPVRARAEVRSEAGRPLRPSSPRMRSSGRTRPGAPARPCGSWSVGEASAAPGSAPDGGELETAPHERARVRPQAVRGGRGRALRGRAARAGGEGGGWSPARSEADWRLREAEAVAAARGRDWEADARGEADVCVRPRQRRPR
jgi:hypothetical protein